MENRGDSTKNNKRTRTSDEGDSDEDAVFPSMDLTDERAIKNVNLYWSIMYRTMEGYLLYFRVGRLTKEVVLRGNAPDLFFEKEVKEDYSCPIKIGYNSITCMDRLEVKDVGEPVIIKGVDLSERKFKVTMHPASGFPVSTRGACMTFDFEGHELRIVVANNSSFNRVMYTKLEENGMEMMNVTPSSNKDISEWMENLNYAKGDRTMKVMVGPILILYDPLVHLGYSKLFSYIQNKKKEYHALYNVDKQKYGEFEEVCKKKNLIAVPIKCGKGVGFFSDGKEIHDM